MVFDGLKDIYGYLSGTFVEDADDADDAMDYGPAFPLYAVSMVKKGLRQKIEMRHHGWAMYRVQPGTIINCYNDGQWYFVTRPGWGVRYNPATHRLPPGYAELKPRRPAEPRKRRLWDKEHPVKEGETPPSDRPPIWRPIYPWERGDDEGQKYLAKFGPYAKSAHGGKREDGSTILKPTLSSKRWRRNRDTYTPWNEDPEWNKKAVREARRRKNSVESNDPFDWENLSEYSNERREPMPKEDPKEFKKRQDAGIDEIVLPTDPLQEERNREAEEAERYGLSGGMGGELPELDEPDPDIPDDLPINGMTPEDLEELDKWYGGPNFGKPSAPQAPVKKQAPAKKKAAPGWKQVPRKAASAPVKGKPPVKKAPVPPKPAAKPPVQKKEMRK